MKDDDPLDHHYRIVESQYLRTKVQYIQAFGNKAIDYVEYVENALLMEKFENKKKAFKTKYNSEDETEYILAFHGTPKPANIESITTNNFSMFYASNKSVYGKGIYFSEFPAVSETYARNNHNVLLLCKVLQGKLDEDYRKVGVDFQLQRTTSDPNEKGWAIIIENVDQILPCYVIHLKNV